MIINQERTEARRMRNLLRTVFENWALESEETLLARLLAEVVEAHRLLYHSA